MAIALVRSWPSAVRKPESGWCASLRGAPTASTTGGIRPPSNGGAYDGCEARRDGSPFQSGHRAGKQVTILALSGEAGLPEGVNPRGLIFAPFSNEVAAPPQDARVRAAVQRVLARVK